MMKKERNFKILKIKTKKNPKRDLTYSLSDKKSFPEK
jgi:hypothetical protein